VDKTVSARAGRLAEAHARALLEQTFERPHTIRSGVIDLDLRVVPTGSTTVVAPIDLSVGGPFSGAAPNVPPSFDFTIAASAQGRHGTLQVISSGAAAYITVAGQSYRAPAATYRNLEAGLGLLAGYSGAGSSGGADSSGAQTTSTLARLGIRPLDWLTDPHIVGTQTISGVLTTRIHASVDATELMRDLSVLAARAEALASRATGEDASVQPISSSAQRSIARAIGSPELDVWTGSADRVVRRLRLSATVPVSGHTRSLLGGLRSVRVSFSFDYSDLNQPQAIPVPRTLRPYRVFHRRVDRLIAELENGVDTSSP